jgi:hypothetical protein
MPDRPSKLYFTGERDAAGNPTEFFGVVPETGEAVPARDLDEGDLAQLSDRTIKVITGERAGGRPPLYQKSEPASRRADEAPKAAKAAKKSTAKKPAAAAKRTAGKQAPTPTTEVPAETPAAAAEPEPVDSGLVADGVPDDWSPHEGTPGFGGE